MKYVVDTFPGREISIDGKPHLYFGGTSYLGLQSDEEFQNILIKNIKNYGTNYGASRKSNVQISVFKKVESYIANLVGSEAAVTMSSGYLAGQLVSKALHQDSYKHFYAPEVHTALQISSKKTFATFLNLDTAIRAHLDQHQTTPVLFLDSVDMAGENYPDFHNLKQLPLDQMILVVDDSHGIGIVGSNGGGAYKTLQALRAKELIVCCSLGKGFGIQAGAIFGAKKRISEFANSELFGGASPASPAMLKTLIDAEPIFKMKRKILKQHIDSFVNMIQNIGQFKYLEAYPSFGFSNAELVTHLQKNDIIITNFNYPTSSDPLVSRIVISSAHIKSDIQRLASVINTLHA